MLDLLAPERRPADLEKALERSAGGDAAAFNAIVAATAPKLFRLATRLMGNLQDAEDVLQDAYIRAYDAARARRFEGRSGVSTWLYRIVTNAALDALRARQRLAAQRGEADEQAQSGRSVEASAELRELATWLAELPGEQRAALVLKELEGLTSGKIAEILGCSEGAVEQRLVRARATLRERSERE
jgi:RNA polymerase sigma-70 factor, ECF subfamily